MRTSDEEYVEDLRARWTLAMLQDWWARNARGPYVKLPKAYLSTKYLAAKAIEELCWVYRLDRP